jgi:hypothetical protein
MYSLYCNYTIYTIGKQHEDSLSFGERKVSKKKHVPNLIDGRTIKNIAIYRFTLSSTY